MLFNSTVQASVSDLPDDFEGYHTRLEMEKLDNEEELHPSFEATINIIYEVGSYIYNKYTIEDISNHKFINVLKKFFPEDNNEQLEKKRSYLEAGYYFYNKVKDSYNKVISYKLVPDKPKEIHSEDEFDHPDEVPYKKAPEGKFYVVHNFKKFLTYSDNDSERQSIEEYKKKKQAELSFFDKIQDSLQKIEWKKVWLYGYKYDNPLLSKLGTGTWQQSPYFKLRLISPNTYIDNNKNIDFGVQIITDMHTYILANNLAPDRLKPQIDLSESENIRSLTVSYPVPFNSKSHPYVYKYYGDFIIPIKAEIEDVTKKVTLKGQIKLVSCDVHLDCDNYTYPLELTMDPSGPDYLPNGLNNYFFQDLSYLPKEENAHLKLRKLFVDNSYGKQKVHVQFMTDKQIKNFKVFLEEENGYTKFSPPFVRLHDDKIEVNFEVMDEQKGDLVGKPLVITASLNDFYNIRNTQVAELVSDFDPDKASLNWGIVLFAVLGGIILNFMPCVFPVLSLKIVSFSRAEEKHRKRLRHSLWLTSAGIFTGFTVLIMFLVGAKYLGYSLGWGVQFQNLSFLIIMTFVLSCFIVLMPSIDFNYVSRFTNQSLNPRTTFLIGNLIVLLSTPCTGPYLATAIGFALSGTYIELVVILYAVALGLSLPYLFILLAKEPEKIFPKPGPWMRNLYIVTQTMLFLTILWFFSLIWGQTDIIFVCKMIGFVLVFVWIFFIHHRFQIYLSGVLDENIPDTLVKKSKYIGYFLLGFIFIAICGYCAHLAQKSYNANYATQMVNRTTKIDKTDIQQRLSQGRSVLLEIGADWCMTCHVNNFLILTEKNLEFWKNTYHLDFIKVDWTNYSEEILNYMEKYGRKGIPFYVLYTPFVREGMVLPEIFSLEELQNLIYNASKR